MTEFLVLLLAVGIVLSLLFAACCCVAWQQSRRANAVLVHRLETEGQIEAATVLTMAAMREAAREAVRRQTQ